MDRVRHHDIHWPALCSDHNVHGLVHQCPWGILSAYKIQYQLNMTTSVGTTSPGVGSTWHDAGSTVTIGATPPFAIISQHYYFSGWIELVVVRTLAPAIRQR